MSNPFTMVYEALWDLAEGSIPLTTWVHIGNRIKLDSAAHSAGAKEEVSQRDLPEVILALTSLTGNIHGSSSGSSITRQFQWQISTGDLRPDKLLEVEWALYCAMADWKAVLGNLALGYGGKITRMNIVNADAGLSDPERNRGIKGWSALWTVEIEMWFGTQLLIDYNLGTGTGTGS